MEAFIVTAIPINLGFYSLHVQQEIDEDESRDFAISQPMLSRWLASRGCAMSADQVRRGKRSQVGNPPVTREELEILGLDLSGI